MNYIGNKLVVFPVPPSHEPPARCMISSYPSEMFTGMRAFFQLTRDWKGIREFSIQG